MFGFRYRCGQNIGGGTEVFWAWGFEWVPQDMWVGVYWRWDPERWRQCWPIRVPFAPMLDIWICIVPCLPFHIRREPRYTPPEQRSHE